jgi:hypothetical protein
LGMKISCLPTDLRIYVNGVDITKSVVLEEIRIVIERAPESKGVVIAPPK